jgi:hypothetical protein
MMARVCVLALIAGIGLGCGARVLDFEDPQQDVGPGGAGGSATTAGAGGTLASASLCGGTECASDETCCLLDGDCFDANAEHEACPTPAPDEHGPRCASNADCGSSQFCESDGLCLGPGHCVDRSNCGTSGGMPWCGCDGVTYPDKQTSCLAGVRLATQQACGVTHTEGVGGSASFELSVTGCGHSSQCPTGQHCCYITGRCYDPAHPALCSFPTRA